MGKKIAILATNGFEDAELIYPFYRLKEAGHESILISLQKQPIKGKNGYPITPDFKIDEVNPDNLRSAFTKVFASFQRGKGLEEFEFLGGYVLISGDGTGQFSSSKVSCPHCCKKVHRNGTTTYYHQMFGVCVVHPDRKNVIPLCPEPICNEDGVKKITVNA